MSEGERLFPAPAEHERIAALEPNDAPALSRRANHQPVDRRLRDRRTPSPFADEDPSRRPARSRTRDHQRVVEHDIRFGETSCCLEWSAAPDRPDPHRRADESPRPEVQSSIHSLDRSRRALLIHPHERLEQQRPAVRHRHGLSQPMLPSCPCTLHPSVEIVRKDGLERFADQAGERRRGAICRDGDIVTPARRKTAPANTLAFSTSSTAFTSRPLHAPRRRPVVDGPWRSRDHETHAVQIRFVERPLTDVHDLVSGYPSQVRGHNRNLCASVEQAARASASPLPHPRPARRDGLKAKKDGKNRQLTSPKTSV